MSTQKVEPHQSSLGMEANLAVLVAYLGGIILSFIPGIRYFGWLVPIVIFFVEKNSSFVRFHAMQSFLLGIISMVIGVITAVFSGALILTSISSGYNGAGLASAMVVLGGLVSLVLLVYAIIAIVSGYQYKEYKIPFIGGWAESFCGKKEIKEDVVEEAHCQKDTGECEADNNNPDNGE